MYARNGVGSLMKISMSVRAGLWANLSGRIGLSDRARDEFCGACSLSRRVERDNQRRPLFRGAPQPESSSHGS